jgi:hypothetical protein
VIAVEMRVDRLGRDAADCGSSGLGYCDRLSPLSAEAVTARDDDRPVFDTRVITAVLAAVEL